MVWKASQQANMLLAQAYLDQVRSLCAPTLKAQEATTKGVYRLPHANYYIL